MTDSAGSETTECAVLCADGRVCYGNVYFRGVIPDRIRQAADAWSGVAHCGGGPHVIASRTITVTDWTPDAPKSLPSNGNEPA